MENVMNNSFCELNMEEMEVLDGGTSVGGIASSALAGAAVGATVGGVGGFVVGAIVSVGVGYLYDSI